MILDGAWDIFQALLSMLGGAWKNTSEMILDAAWNYLDTTWWALASDKILHLDKVLQNPYNICIFKYIHNSGKSTGKAIKA